VPRGPSELDGRFFIREVRTCGWFLVYPSQFAGTAKSTAMSFDVANLEEAVKELRDRGVVFEEYDMPGLKTVNGIAEIQGVKGAWFKDPDGYILAVGERT
jgi:hypothetical protein